MPSAAFIENSQVQDQAKMSGGPRRSARIAELRAVAEVENRLPAKVADADIAEEVSTDTDGRAGDGRAE